MGTAHGVFHRALHVRIVAFSRVALHRFQIADDDHKKIVEVVGDTTAKLTYCFHFLRCCELLLGLAQHALGLNSLSDISCHFSKADKLACLVANGVDYDRCPKLSAVLPDPSALGFKLSRTPSGFECIIGDTRRPIFFRIEPG